MNNKKFFDYLLDSLLHLLIVGPSGTGKSKLVEAMIRHLSLRRNRPTIILLDPGGSTAMDMENFVTKHSLFDNTVILDPREDNFYLGFNPLRPADLPLSLQSKIVQESLLTALEIDHQDSIYYMPLLEQVLYYLAYLLMETGYTLNEAQHLLTAKPSKEANAIIEKANTPQVKSFWNDLQGMKLNQRQQMLGLAQARLLPFLTSNTIQRMIAQRRRALDFSTFIEQGGLFVANLESYSTLTPLDSKLLANLIISSVVRACFARPAYTGREVYLFIEECGEGLIGTEIGKMLRRARKHRLKVILINQDISSVREEDPVVFRQIWANTSHKLVFRDLPQEDLDLIGLEFFAEEFNLKRVKQDIHRTFFEPKESERTISSYGSGYSSFEGEGGGFSDAEGQTIIPQEGFLTEDIVHHHQSSASASSFSSGEGYSEHHGETTIPFYEYLKRKELSSREFYSLEELLHQAKVFLKGLRKREIALKRRGKNVQVLKVPYVSNIPRVEKYHDRMRKAIFTKTGTYSTIKEIEAEERKRLKALQPSATREPTYKG